MEDPDHMAKLILALNEVFGDRQSLAKWMAGDDDGMRKEIENILRQVEDDNEKQ